MADRHVVGESVVLINCFYIRGKRQRATLTTRSISWESESSPDLCTVVPLNEVIAVTPCDCTVDQRSRKIKCHHCRHSRDQISPASSELLPLHSQSLRLHYAVPSGKHQWDLSSVVFCPLEGTVLREWVAAFQAALLGLSRPRKLLVFINPYGGKRKAPKIYEKKVSPLFQLAGIEAQVIVTERANHAKEIIQEMDLKRYNGLICVGGDGMFSELLNGLLIRTQQENEIDVNDMYSTYVSPKIPLGVIPAGSTDAVSYCTTGADDPVTSTLLIIMGDSISIDVCSIHSEGNMLRFQTSFLAYGYFGDTLLDSEKHRWMGPKRYNWSGIKKFFRRRLYDGELQLQVTSLSDRVQWERERCRTECSVCTKAAEVKSMKDGLSNQREKARWLTVRGQFVAVNIATMACSCGMTLEGISPSAHLGSGFCDVVLVSRCSRINYMRYLFRTSWHNQSPFDLHFIQLYRVREFKFSPTFPEGDRTPAAGCTGVQENHQRILTSVWNCDGEVIFEPAIHGRVHCQLVKVFARGIEDRDVESSCSHCLGFCKKKRG